MTQVAQIFYTLRQNVAVGEIRVELKLKLVSEVEVGWSWDKCGQSEQMREGVFGEKVYPKSPLLCQEPLQLLVIKGTVVVWSKESGLLQTQALPAHGNHHYSTEKEV